MIYLLDGKETYYLEKKKKDLLNQEDLLKENIVTLDASNKTTFSIQEGLNLCSTISLFSERRIVIFDNPYFLKSNQGKTTTATKKKKNQLSIAQYLEEYCSNPSDTTDLILYCFGYDVDKRTQEFKVLDKYKGKTVTHIHFGDLSPYEFENLVNKQLSEGGYHLEKNAKEEFMMRIAGSVSQFYQGYEKIVLYGKKELNLDDIEHLINVNLDVDIWKLGNAFLAKDARRVWQSYRELTDMKNMSPTGVLPMLASQIRGVYNSLVCFEQGYPEYQIKQMTGRMYPNRDIESARNYRAKDLLKMLKELADLDQGIKMGLVKDTDGFEQFLLRYL